MLFIVLESKLEKENLSESSKYYIVDIVYYADFTNA
jgi:hypothetical protein